MNLAEVPADLLDEAALQLDGDGNLRRLITLEGLDKSLLIDVPDDAESYLTQPGILPARSDLHARSTVANLFFEPSMRTCASFGLAGR